ncbi:MAG: zf-HC2 domain-containing protein, partial [Pseudomonadota bacterium]
MSDFSEQLSAYLDGELSAEDAAMVEARLASDPAAQAELDALMAAEAEIAEEFDAMLAEPVPFKLAQTIKTFDMPASEPAASPAAPANAPRPIWG